MEVRFYLDPETGLPHLHDHGVSEQEACDVLRMPFERFPSRANSHIVYGQTRAGRFLKVIASFDDDGKGVFVITAYDLSPKELKALRRRMRRRP